MKNRLPYDMNTNPYVIVFGMLFLIIVPFIVWSSTTQIEQKSSIYGQVIPVGKVNEVQAPIEGIIEKYYVQEGTEVKKDQVLVKLEEEKYLAALNATENKVNYLTIKLQRLRAEVFKNVFNPQTTQDEQINEYIKNELNLYKLKKKKMNDELKITENRIQIQEKKALIAQRLFKKGDIGQSKVIEEEERLLKLKQDKSNLENEFYKSTQEEMNKVEEELSLSKQQLKEKEINLKRLNIKSNINGFVKEVLINSVGSSVKPGQIIMTILPQEDELIIEGRLKPVDISYVKIGQKAHVKFDTYDYTIFGMFEGEVKYISPDSIKDETSKDNEYYFKVLISVKKESMKKLKNVSISAGMRANIDIITGKRTVMDFLTKPITKTIDSSFKER